MNYLKVLLSKSQHTLLQPKDGAHSVLDDLQGVVTGTLMLSLGVVFFHAAHLYTGGVTGVALALNYWSNISVSWLLMLVNLPFYLMAYLRFGKHFVFKSLFAVTLMAIMISFIEKSLNIQTINPYFAAVMGGLLVGTGMIFLFRHRSSTGGFNVLVLYLQDKKQWNAGLVQMALDFCVISFSVFTGSGDVVAASFLGAAVMNLSISINHRPGRYISF